jgi:hypothetical protein
VRFDVITLFPEMLRVLTDCGITRRAHEGGLWQLATWNPREFTSDAHRTVDDRPFGGGPGMVMLAEPLAQAVEAAQAAQRAAGVQRPRVLAFAASGLPLTDAKVRRWAGEGGGAVLVCGRYEGIDQRFLDEYVDEEVSIGDFVLSGGEVAALALIDAVVRRRAARRPAVHPAGGVARALGAGGVALRSPRADRRMAAAAGAGAHGAAAARAAANGARLGQNRARGRVVARCRSGVG